MTTHLDACTSPPTGSLRWAVEQANANPGPDQVKLSPGLPDVAVLCTIVVSDEMTLNAGGGKIKAGASLLLFRVTANHLTVTDAVLEGGGSTWATTGGFSVEDDCKLTLSGVQVSKFGRTPIFSNRGASLFIYDSSVTFNAYTSFGGEAGAIHNGSTVSTLTPLTIIERSTLCDNQGYWAGAIYQAGGTLKVGHSVLCRNHATLGPGAILVQSNANATTDVTLANSTVSNNHSDLTGASGAAVELVEPDAVLRNVTFALNTQAGTGATALRAGANLVAFNCLFDEVNACHGAFSGDGNGDRADSCQISGNGNLQWRDFQLTALGPYGGPTHTHKVGAGSDALDAGDSASCPADDQRGFARFDGACDVGAYEYH